jgi:hypothetical protein
MKTKSKIMKPDVLLPRGSRDAVETAIDSAKDGNAWDAPPSKIRPWESSKDVPECEEQELAKEG